MRSGEGVAEVSVPCGPAALAASSTGASSTPDTNAGAEMGKVASSMTVSFMYRIPGATGRGGRMAGYGSG